MSLLVGLRGYPEAILATDVITLDVPPKTTAAALVHELACRFARLGEALLHEDGSPRQSTKVLVDGAPVTHHSLVGGDRPVTILASLPCDG